MPGRRWIAWILPILFSLSACSGNNSEEPAPPASDVASQSDSQGDGAQLDADDAAPAHYGLIIEVEGEGSVDTELVSGEILEGEYSSGSVVRLTGLAEPGSSFGGWSGDVQDVVNPLEITISAATTVHALFFRGSSCVDSPVDDVFADILMATTHPMGSKEYGCLIVDKANGFPVLNGDSSARFEVRQGDCSSNDGFDDCENDRSRHEINEAYFAEADEQVITYTTAVYIPQQSRIRPKGSNILILSQVNVANKEIFNALAYLMVSNSMKLYVQTHEDFTWTPAGYYEVSDDPFGRWFEFTWEVYASTSDQGYLKVYLGNELLFTETRPTLPSEDARVSLKFGIYNAFLSDAYEPYENQVIFVDGVSKTVQSRN